MANIDFIEAKKEIEKIFAETEKNSRKIIFWYDAPRNFIGDVVSDNFDCCKVLVCDHNEFEIKMILEHDDTLSNYLVYIPYAKPEDEQNWLLDVLLYSTEYYADTVALTMRRLNLTNSDLRRVVDRYSKFFDSEARIKKLSTLIEINDELTAVEFAKGILAVLVKSNALSIESVLTELVFDDAELTKYNEASKFGMQEFLWEQIATCYNYDGIQSINALAKKFMFTALLEQKTNLGNLPSFYSQFVIANNAKSDAKFFIERLKADKRYGKLQSDIAEELKIEALFIGRDVSAALSSDVFEVIEINIISTITKALKDGSVDYDNFERVILSRINSMWYPKYYNEYELLKNAIEYFKSLDKKIKTGLTAVEYVRAYAESYYKIDSSYRNICYHYSLIELEIEEFEALLDRVELAYEWNYLSIIGKEFSDSLKQLNGVWDFKGIAHINDFYQLTQRQQYKKMFVIISDAMRYEVAEELCQEFKADGGIYGNVALSYAISALPSETRLGMASLLPHKELSYENKTVLTDGLPTNSTANRDKVLKAKNSSYAAITFDEIRAMKETAIRKYMSDKTVVYIYHNRIDNAGENIESSVLESTKKSIKEIFDLVKWLYNRLQISNYFVTSDHGFLYRRNRVEESQKYSNIVVQKLIEASKRYIIAEKGSVEIPYSLEFNLNAKNESDLSVFTPYSNDLFKTQGSGLQYIHGGASLQEIVVPIIHLSEMRSSKQKDSIGVVGVKLKSITRKITNRSFTLEFLQYDKVEDKKQAVTCESYLVDELGNKVSPEYKIVAESKSDDLESRVTRIRFTLKNIEFNRNNVYYLILKHVGSEEFIEKVQFTIDILNLKPF